MEEKKYYTPTEESEIYVGLEIEVAEVYFHTTPPTVTGKWTRTEINNLGLAQHLWWNLREFIRIPYLCKEDIEAMGWKVSNGLGNIPVYFKEGVSASTKQPCRFHLAYKNGWAFIEELKLPLSINVSATRFSGSIKNKSRLKLLMEMVGII